MTKKSGVVELFDKYKIINAVNKSANRVGVKLSDSELEQICSLVEGSIPDNTNIEQLHAAVQSVLMSLHPLVGDSYSSFRNYKLKHKADYAEIIKDVDAMLMRGDKSNANADSALVSTKGSLMRGYLAKNLYKSNYLSTSELKAISDGYIYIHDLDNMITGSFNCCLVDMGRILSGGFEMCGLNYEQPSTILSAIQVLGDVTLSTSAQQFGGYTIPEVDKILAPYVHMSEMKLKADCIKYGIIGEDARLYIDEKLHNEIKQGIQSLEFKLNSIPSSRGDFAFTTLTFGNFDTDEFSFKYQRMICEAIIDQRVKGHGVGESVPFPKLVWIYSKEQHELLPFYDDLLTKAVSCTMKTMYPDYLSIDSEFGHVSEMYRKYKKVVSPMGCRAYLSDCDAGEFVGRANIGAVSLNLPMIYQGSLEGSSIYNEESFFGKLDLYLNMIESFLLKRYDHISSQKCSTNPVMYCQGGLLGGNKKPDELVGDIVDTFTASFGITALNELNNLHEGVGLKESNRLFVNSVVDHILTYIKIAKERTGRLFALYGTPAESLCATQCRQFKELFGEVDGVTTHEYFSNSFHLHVTESINPFDKQDAEFELFHKISGGHIQYFRVDNKTPVNSVKWMILRGMELGFYQGVNTEVGICKNCGSKEVGHSATCPLCKSTDVVSLARVCGYIGYYRKGGTTRLHDVKVKEVSERVSM